MIQGYKSSKWKGWAGGLQVQDLLGQLSKILSKDEMCALGYSSESCLTCTKTWADPALHKTRQEAEAGGLHIPDQVEIPSKIVFKENSKQKTKSLFRW